MHWALDLVCVVVACGLFVFASWCMRQRLQQVDEKLSDELDGPDADKNSQTETFPVYNSLPMRLSVCPAAIQQHFECDDRVQDLTEDQLLQIGEHVLISDAFYKAFHECLVVATDEIGGFRPQ